MKEMEYISITVGLISAKFPGLCKTMMWALNVIDKIRQLSWVAQVRIMSLDDKTILKNGLF